MGDMPVSAVMDAIEQRADAIGFARSQLMRREQ